MSAHARYSPSSLEKLELCPSYEQSSGTSPAAEEGTMLHGATEREDVTGLDEEQETVVQQCIDLSHDLIDQYPTPPKVYKELKVDVGSVTAGTLDLLIIGGAIADLLDWKFGKQPVTHAKDNIQIQSYTLGVFEKFPQLTKICSHIVCPRQRVATDGVYARSDMPAVRHRIQNIIIRCEQDNPEEIPSEKACRWCSRKAECVALTSTALEVAKNIGLPLPIEFQPGRLVRPTDRAKAQVLSFILEDWAKKVREYNTKAVLEDGIEIPGFELKSRKGKLKVVDINAVADIAKEKFGLPKEAVMMACSMSLPKLVDQVFAQAQTLEGKVTKKDTKEDLIEAIKEQVIEERSVHYLQKTRGTNDEEIIRG